MTKQIPLVVEASWEVKCPTCNDVGNTYYFDLEDGPYQTPSRVGDKWLDDIDGLSGWFHGHLIETPCPDCNKYAAHERLIKLSGLHGDDTNIRLSMFATDKEKAAKKNAKDNIALFAGMGKDANGFVTIYGDYGVGKSFLAKALINELIMNDCHARYILASDMIADIRVNFDEQSNRNIAIENAIYKWQSIPALIIDEFDKVNTTDWVKESMNRLLNVRYENRKHQLTVMVSNTDPKKLPPELGYLQSRMFAGITIYVPGPDVRVMLGKIERGRMN